jgi:integrase
VWLGPEAVALLRRQDVVRLQPYVFPGRTQGKPLQSVNHTWERIRTRAGLPDRRLHDLRHTQGAKAASSGMSQATIAAILGHRSVRTAEIYSSPHRDPTAIAAASVSSGIARDLANEEKSEQLQENEPAVKTATGEEE